MSQYTPPNADMMFVLNDVLGFKSDIVDAETLEAVLELAVRRCISCARNVAGG